MPSTPPSSSFTNIWKRSISFLKPTPTTIIPTQAELNISTNNIINTETPLPHDNDGSTTEFKILGSPPTMALISLPSSVPLYIKRKHLISIFDKQNSKNTANTTSMSTRWVQPWKNLFLWQNSMPIYQKIITTTNFGNISDENRQASSDYEDTRLKLLVSSSQGGSLAGLQLDGSKDWFIFGGSQSILVFEDNSSLNITPKFSFKTLFKKFHQLNGRGNVILNGKGSSIYSIELSSPDEEILVRVDNLLGLSGASISDLQKNVHPFVFSKQKEGVSSGNKLENDKRTFLGRIFDRNSTIAKTKDEVKVTIKQQTLDREFGLKDFIEISKNGISNISTFITYYYYQFLNGNLSLWGNLNGVQYCKLRGPRTILIQSNGLNSRLLDDLIDSNQRKSILPASALNELSFSSSSESKIKDSKNYLSYATFDKNGNVHFQSTPNFDESIEKIKQSLKKH
ncbi:uncharacterized protein SCODWIG_02542 [Saccharomycodes ludwigii]|uniref:Altered inheritance of mitochondria protein 24, mitochondrial n=1 Tax=Saccharomycodes ludwigii TaxID=36035 RepID=A0A376B842_9ASCO|nr:hypothetical protein SCDLUD_000119 [Saccharomycodes ludwigii]KAH3902540.1 hypothetical protein SCDLUD_000119 [Saccharomycodes ludwigii]SSD60781.1 uncharacterized protein SCODWIG_02542 [Saccharomycodes ludwigii]